MNKAIEIENFDISSHKEQNGSFIITLTVGSKSASCELKEEEALSYRSFMQKMKVLAGFVYHGSN